jgi:hypothetical protein
VLERELALAGEVEGVLRVLDRDPVAQFAHRLDRIHGGGGGAALAEEVVQRQFGALDRRPDGPERVVEVEAEGLGRLHPRIVEPIR